MCPRPRPHRGRASFANGQNFREVGLHQCPSERKGEGVPVRSLHVPSHVPSHPQTAAKVRGFSLTASGFTAETDWLLEEADSNSWSHPERQRSERIRTLGPLATVIARRACETTLATPGLSHLAAWGVA